MELSVSRPSVLVIGADVQRLYVSNLKQWLEPFCEAVFATTSYGDAVKISNANVIDIFIVVDYGKEMSVAFKHKVPNALVCMLTSDPHLFCKDLSVKSIQKPLSKAVALREIFNQWVLHEQMKENGGHLGMYTGTWEVMKIEPQERLVATHLRLAKNPSVEILGVALRHTYSPNNRNICITLKEGCEWGCKFCGTAKICKRFQLNCHEMAAQVHYLKQCSIAYGSADERITVSAHGGGDPRSKACRIEYCKAVRLIEKDHPQTRYISTSIGGEGVFEYMMERLGGEVDICFENSRNSTIKSIRDSIMPATKDDPPIEKVVELFSEYTIKYGIVCKLRHMQIKGLTDNEREADNYARALEGSPVGLIITNMEPGCLPDYPGILSKQDGLKMVSWCKDRGIKNVVFNDDVGTGMVKCGKHISMHARQTVEKRFKKPCL